MKQPFGTNTCAIPAASVRTVPAGGGVAVGVGGMGVGVGGTLVAVGVMGVSVGVGVMVGVAV